MSILCTLCSSNGSKSALRVLYFILFGCIDPHLYYCWLLSPWPKKQIKNNLTLHVAPFLFGSDYLFFFCHQCPPSSFSLPFFLPIFFFSSSPFFLPVAKFQLPFSFHFVVIPESYSSFFVCEEKSLFVSFLLRYPLNDTLFFFSRTFLIEILPLYFSF